MHQVGAPHRQRHGGKRLTSEDWEGWGQLLLLMLGLALILCQGVRRISPVTRAEEFYYPPWKRLFFQLFVSVPLCLTCLACVFLLMLGCFQLQVTSSSPQP